jgi:hypothetical protein
VLALAYGAGGSAEAGAAGGSFFLGFSVPVVPVVPITAAVKPAATPRGTGMGPGRRSLFQAGEAPPRATGAYGVPTMVLVAAKTQES